MNLNPLSPRIPLGEWADKFLTWFQDVFGWLLDFISTVLTGMYTGLELVFASPSFLIMTVILAVIAWLCAGWKVGLVTLIGFYLVRAFNQWENAMESLALVLVAVIIALIIALPVGVWAAKSKTVSAIVRPVLDFMQSMPALAYLVPAIVMFSVGTVPGAIATIIFALPPGVRFTELAIRQVDGEVVEAAQAFGAGPSHILFRVQLPLALPTIMAGINQVIMLALSMVVLAGMAGADGLGGAIIEAISSVNVALGVEAGVSVVALAIFLDRVTAGLGRKGNRVAAA
ncbi:ABC transporter permease subunit [Brevibacterium sp. 50QC2O2]|jgi:glycine betaine/proline transport system permease protein|uniref:ABC transporter permease n=1 Tax=Brevibacterium TaxID=1696 RepID=UPI00211BF1A8|nr:MULTISPECIES: ABC transporter permease subunit [unclassified Brevibacterium]MCQ9386672.1 ABC transporter permease subunit [Brevibacterium sp. 68QC2CO]MCQ9388685.1 ABC transporter permease subunit [Brevibacterium sp. 50QC2O2]